MKRGTGQHRITWPASMRVRMKSSRLCISTPGPRHLTMPSACVRYAKRCLYVQKQSRILSFGSIENASIVCAHSLARHCLLIYSPLWRYSWFLPASSTKDASLKAWLCGTLFSCIAQQKTAWNQLSSLQLTGTWDGVGFAPKEVDGLLCDSIKP